MRRLAFVACLLCTAALLGADADPKPDAKAPPVVVQLPTPPLPPEPPIDWTKIIALVTAAVTAVWTAYQEIRHQFANRPVNEIAKSAAAEAITLLLQNQPKQPTQPVLTATEVAAIEAFRQKQGGVK